MRAVRSVSVALIRLEVEDVCAVVVHIIKSVDTFVSLVIIVSKCIGLKSISSSNC